MDERKEGFLEAWSAIVGQVQYLPSLEHWTEENQRGLIAGSNVLYLLFKEKYPGEDPNEVLEEHIIRARKGTRMGGGDEGRVVHGRGAVPVRRGAH